MANNTFHDHRRPCPVGDNTIKEILQVPAKSRGSSKQKKDLELLRSRENKGMTRWGHPQNLVLWGILKDFNVANLGFIKKIQ